MYMSNIHIHIYPLYRYLTNSPYDFPATSGPTDPPVCDSATQEVVRSAAGDAGGSVPWPMRWGKWMVSMGNSWEKVEKSREIHGKSWEIHGNIR